MTLKESYIQKKGKETHPILFLVSQSISIKDFHFSLQGIFLLQEFRQDLKWQLCEFRKPGKG